jgi:phosphatidylglycerol:prolipoprotein diacylglycerol transferase
MNIIKVWEGGMSFHGGALGVIIATLAFTKIHKIQFLKLIDEIVFILPI